MEIEEVPSETRDDQLLESLARMPPRLRLVGMSLEERLAGLTPDERREALRALALPRLTEMEQLEGYKELIERAILSLSPQLRLAGLTPRQRIEGLP